MVKQDYDANILMAKMVAEDLERDNNTASVLASSSLYFFVLHDACIHHLKGSSEGNACDGV